MSDMSNNKETEPTMVEIESLNADDLDIEELENRIELASASSALCWGDGSCVVN